MKMATDIPEEITTPDIVETRIGTLNFKNGIPDQATRDKIWDHLDFARAVEVYLNTLPVVSMYAARKGPRDVGVPDNTIMTMETMMDSTGMFLTPNTVTPQSWITLDLTKGPIVVEVPPKVLGLFDDSWFRYVTDIGFTGPDKGKGGKYLFLPPDYKGDVPDGHANHTQVLLMRTRWRTGFHRDRFASRRSSPLVERRPGKRGHRRLRRESHQGRLARLCARAGAHRHLRLCIVMGKFWSVSKNKPLKTL